MENFTVRPSNRVERDKKGRRNTMPKTEGREFIRTELILGAGRLKKLRDSSVAVFGIGGVGSHCAEALARSGVGRLILVDNDVVSESNINRQCVAFHHTIGRQKTEVMREMIGQICPETEVLTFDTFVLEDNLNQLFEEAGQVDYVVDAVDTVSAKLALTVYAKKHRLPFIASMGTGNKLHPELFALADIEETSVCPLCRIMRKELKHRGITGVRVLYSPETPAVPDQELMERLMREELSEGSARRSVPGSIAFVPPAAGLLIAGEVVRSLSGIT